MSFEDKLGKQKWNKKQTQTKQNKKQFKIEP